MKKLIFVVLCISFSLSAMENKKSEADKLKEKAVASHAAVHKLYMSTKDAISVTPSCQLNLHFYLLDLAAKRTSLTPTEPLSAYVEKMHKLTGELTKDNQKLDTFLTLANPPLIVILAQMVVPKAKL